MNDFTKEELELINFAVMEVLKKAVPIEMEYVQEKIQSLIDNYCEHDNVKSLSDINYVYKCSECNKVLSYE